MTQTAALLGMLQRGGWVTCAEILREHPMIVHSRVADLRKKGYAVEHETTGKGAAGSRYRLVSLEASAQGVPVVGNDGSAGASSEDGSERSPGTPSSFGPGEGQDAASPDVVTDNPGADGRPDVAPIPGQLALLPPLPTRGWLDRA